MKKILSTLGILSLLLISLPLNAASYPVGGSNYFLSGAGITSTATTIQLTSFTLPDGTLITMSMFGATGYAAIDPQTTAKLENISFTGVTQNVNGTATLTGVTRGLAFNTPYSSSASLMKSHSGGATFILTNTASYYGTQFAMVNNPNAFSDYNTVPDPLGMTGIANKEYVLSVVSGGPITNTSVVTPGTAGETVSAGQVLYLKTSDARWYKLIATVPNNLFNVIVGIAQGSGTAGVAITGGVLLHGLDTHQTNLTTGANQFASSTVSGALGIATTTKAIGKATSATSIYMDPYFVSPTIFPSSISVNGVAYTYPASQGASSTVMFNDGTGTLQWEVPGYGTLLSTTTPTGTAQTSTTTVLTIPIPANTLDGTSRFLRATAHYTSVIDNGSDTCGYDIAFGNGTASTTVGSVPTASGNSGGYSQTLITATSTSAEAVWTTANNASYVPTGVGVATTPYVSNKYAAVNLAAKSYLSIAGIANSATCNLDGILVEVLRP